jgi:phosphatidylserine/phosphatidylglycerophosphate/cardiolipin synthase-like enzyme
MIPSAPHRLGGDVEWASQIAERLPEADVVKLATAAAEGVHAVLAFRGQAPASVLREACDQVVAKLNGSSPLYIAGLLTGSVTAVRRARGRQTVDVVWTGPESGVATSRLTAAAVIDLVGQARRELLLVSYATQTDASLAGALAGAARRGVEITLVTERHADNPAFFGTDAPFPGLRAVRLHWPASERPQGASLHAKIIIVDDEIALITSANLTSRAMEANIECGILIRGPQPRAVRDHITGLYASGILQRL